MHANNHNDDDENTQQQQQTAKTPFQQWKQKVVNRVVYATPFTLLASSSYYFIDLYRTRNDPLPPNRLRFHQTRIFRALNIFTNMTTMSFLYFGTQQYLSQREQQVFAPQTVIIDNEQHIIENKYNTILQHSAAGFVTGTAMHALITAPSSKEIVTRSTRLGLLFAVASALGYKVYEQFVYYRYRLAVRKYENEWREQQGINNEEETETISERIIHNLPEWLRQEDEDMATMRERYQQMRIIREEIKRIAIEEADKVKNNN
jgi:hypothetical protein